MADPETIPTDSPADLQTDAERRQARFASLVFSEMGMLRAALAEHGQLLAVIHQMAERQGVVAGDILERIRRIEIDVELIKGTLMINEATRLAR